MKEVVPLAKAHETAVFGSKAVGLGQALREGLPVPPGVALSGAVVDAVTNGADGAVPGLAISDTVKRVRTQGATTVVTETVPRAELVTVQTPQAFRRDVLVRAHASADDATDDAALVEAHGGRVVVVPGERQNVKITEPGDLSNLSTTVRS